MNADEAMIVVILGDDDVKPSVELGESPYNFDIEIKEEVLNDTENIVVEELLQTAEKHGEHLGPEIFHFIKKNKEEPFVDEDDSSDEEFVPNEKVDSPTLTSTDDDNYNDNYNDDDFIIKKNKKTFTSIKKQTMNRVKVLEPSEFISYVAKVREENPHFDNNQLVAYLADVMKNTKPPPPPQDYFRVDSIGGSSNSLMFECIDCSALSNTQPAAARHYQDKHGPRYLVCFACGASFRSVGILYKHEKRCRAPDSTWVLQARALSVGRKGRHRPFLHLQNEISIEEKHKTYNCEECPAVFRSSTTLKAHMHLHRGERPYTCDQCEAAYTNHSGLYQHRQKHNGTHYICDTCGRDFKSTTAFAYHMETHLPRKFVCPYEECGRRYAQKGALNVHVTRRHHRLPPPCACQLCPRRFSRMSLLKKHMMDKHGMTLMTRNMFCKKLPTLSEFELKQAKIFFDEDKDHVNFELPAPAPAPATEIRVKTENIEYA